MKLESMTDLYVNVLQDMHNGEKQLLKALPQMAKGASSPELAEALKSHLVETKAQAQRLEDILKDLGKKTGSETCEAMQGLIAEGDEMLDASGDDAIRDAGLIIAAQKVEHYEISGYSSLCLMARKLGRAQDLTLLEKTLDEERHADEALAALAEASDTAEPSVRGSGGRKEPSSKSASKR